jgi:hypothetical protein
MHKTIEDLGFAKFNVTSATIASQQQGRFKRFTTTCNITSLRQLGTVFDNDLLWVIERMH